MTLSSTKPSPGQTCIRIQTIPSQQVHQNSPGHVRTFKPGCSELLHYVRYVVFQMPKRQKKSKTDEVQPVPGWGRKDFFRDLKKAVRPVDEPKKKHR